MGHASAVEGQAAGMRPAKHAPGTPAARPGVAPPALPSQQAGPGASMLGGGAAMP